jgi:hypothetical protein
MSTSTTMSDSDGIQQAGPRAHRRRRAAAAGVLILGVALAGCGSSGGGSTTTAAKAASAPAGIPKAQFIAKVNAICAKDDPLLSEATAKLAALRSKAEVTAIVRSTYVPAVQSQISQISVLGSPVGEQTQVVAMLKLVQADLAKLQKDPMLVDTDVFADFAKVAHPYGLTSCAPLS